MSQPVFIALQDNDNARYIANAIMADNPNASIDHQPAMIRIQAEKQLVINHATIEELSGQEWDVQAMLLDVISIGGNVEEDEDQFVLRWN